MVENTFILNFVSKLLICTFFIKITMPVKLIASLDIKLASLDERVGIRFCFFS
jgi:hypothetical protein